MMKKCRRNWSRWNNAMTLVELLVVIGVISVLTAIVLPSIKTILTDRKASQSAIVLRNFLEAARARAVATNRNIAVVFERVSSRPLDTNNDGAINAADQVNGLLVSATAQSFDINLRSTQPDDLNFVPYNTCIQVSLAEQRSPISEKFFPLSSDRRFRMMCRSPCDALAGDPRFIPLPVSVYSGPHELRDLNQQRNCLDMIPERRIFHVSEVIPDTKWGRLEIGGNGLSQIADYLIAGNEIEFPGSQRRFTITAPLSRQPHDAMIANPDSAGVSRIWFAISNQDPAALLGNIDDSIALCTPRQFSTPNEPPPDAPLGETWPPHSTRPIPPSGGFFEQFKIHLPPKSIPGDSLRLPRGMCIDLSISGLANRGNSLNDNRMLFASDFVFNALSSPPNRGVPHPTELRPVYLFFSPDGTISRTYSNVEASSSLARRDSSNDIFLHVGKIDQVVMARTDKVRDVAGFFNALQNGTKMNLSDASLFVLRISPKSGAITAAPQFSIQTQIELESQRRGISITDYLSQVSLGDLIELSRKSTFSSEATSQ